MVAQGYGSVFNCLPHSRSSAPPLKPIVWFGATTHEPLLAGIEAHEIGGETSLVHHIGDAILGMRSPSLAQ
jgi:hypothetical protein